VKEKMALVETNQNKERKEIAVWVEFNQTE